MIAVLFPAALDKARRAQFYTHSMARNRPLSMVVLSFGVLALLLLVITRSVLTHSLAPLASSIGYVVALCLLLAGMLRSTDINVSGAFVIVFVAVLQYAAATSSEAAGTLDWALPSALIIPLCAAPFWLTRAHFAIGTLVSVSVACSQLASLPMTPDQVIASTFWILVSAISSVTCFMLFYAYRVQHFILETKLAELAVTDPLTGAHNRRGFLHKAETLLAESASASALFIDIDHFKQINDRYGHAVGDQVIHDVANMLQAKTNANGLLGRMGGEEFAVLMTACSLPKALVLAESLRIGVKTILHPDGIHHVSVSLGVAEMMTGDSLASLLERADLAMLEAKRRGRDRVETLA